MTDMVDKHETMAHHDLWKSGYNYALRESCLTEDKHMINELRKALYETQDKLKNIIESTNLDHEKAGHLLAMRLLQSDIELDDEEMAACSEFTQPEIIRRILRSQ